MMKSHGNTYGTLALPRSQVRTFLCVCFWFSLGILWSPWGMASPKEAAAAEAQIKAAMLYKFLDYTAWPDTAFAKDDSPYRIWVLGANDIAAELREITSGRTSNSRPIQILHASNLRKLTRPHVVFVGQGAEKYLPEIARLAEQQAFLVVSEDERGIKPGSTINLRVIDGRIGFDVSLTGAKKSNLKLSARLLSVASTVVQEDF